MTDLPQNRRGRRGPDEGLGVAIVMRDVFLDGANQFREAAEGATSNALPGDLGEPALDEIQPRGAGGHEVPVITRMRGEPGFDLGVRVRPGVVEDQVDLAACGDDDVLTFRLAVVHSLPSAIRLEGTIMPDGFWSFAERCGEPAPPTNPNAILSAIATALIRLVGMLSSPPSRARGLCHRSVDSAVPNRGSLTCRNSR